MNLFFYRFAMHLLLEHSSIIRRRLSETKTETGHTFDVFFGDQLNYNRTTFLYKTLKTNTASLRFVIIQLSQTYLYIKAIAE